MNKRIRHDIDDRPPVAIGHVDLQVSDVGSATDYFLNLGMRHVHQEDDFAVLELRGGTHLVLERPEEPLAAGREVPFDLMVDDINVTRQRCVELGMNPSEMETGRIHRSFFLAGPDGYKIRVTSSHASSRPV